MAYESIIDIKKFDILHNLMFNFISSSLEIMDGNTEKGKEMIPLLEGVITTYIPVYMCNQMLFWSGQYWEEFHPVISQRIKSKDLVNTDLQNGLKQLYVYLLV